MAAAPKPSTRRRLPVVLVLVTALCGLAGATLLAYSPTASWFAAINQSAIVDRYQDEVKAADPTAVEQLAQAREYNSLLASGAVLAENANIPTGTGSAVEKSIAYEELLRTPNAIMARLQIPSIDVDLPVFHGTDDETLLRGAGHLKGTSLPVGGTDTHAVITAHRGMANARMFTDLDRLGVGDIFTINTFGEVLTYEVRSTEVIDPSDTATLRQEEGRDLVSLITCTPLGVNTHRILVTGERITPTPPEQISAATEPASTGGFPWWLALYAAAVAILAWYIWWGTRRVPLGPGRTEPESTVVSEPESPAASTPYPSHRDEDHHA